MYFDTCQRAYIETTSAGSCVDCADGCESCQNSAVCLVCAYGWYLGTDYKCYKDGLDKQPLRNMIPWHQDTVQFKTQFYEDTTTGTDFIVTISSKAVYKYNLDAAGVPSFKFFGNAPIAAEQITPTTITNPIVNGILLPLRDSILIVEERPGPQFRFHEISLAQATFGNIVKSWNMNPIVRRPVHLLPIILGGIQSVVYMWEAYADQYSIIQLNDETKFMDFALVGLDPTYTSQTYFFGRIFPSNDQVLLIQTTDFKVHVKFCTILGTNFPDCQDPGYPQNYFDATTRSYFFVKQSSSDFFYYNLGTS